MTTEKTSSDNSRSPGKSVSIQVVSIAITTAASSTEWTNDAEVNGEIVAVVYDMPAFIVHGGLTTVSLRDEDDNEWHAKELTPGTTHTLEKLLPDTAPVRFGFVGTLTLQATTAEQTVIQNQTAKVILYVKHNS